MVKRIISHSGYCSETETIETIDVTFTKVNFLGGSGYKATSYYCCRNSEDNCNSNGSNGLNCPLFREAINQFS